MTSLHDLLRSTLQRIFRAAHQLVGVLPEVAEGVASPELQVALGAYEAVVEQQARRLELAADSIGCELEATGCSGVEGLIELVRGNGAESAGVGGVVDVAVVAALRRLGFASISAYSTARVLAEALGEEAVLRVVEENLRSEEAAERFLTVVSEELIDELSSTPANATTPDRWRGPPPGSERLGGGEAVTTAMAAAAPPLLNFWMLCGIDPSQ